MSEELSEHQKKRQQAEEKLNRAYRIVFKFEDSSDIERKRAVKRVLQDLEDIQKAKSWIPDRSGSYESTNIRGWINEGGRKMASDMWKRIYSKPMIGYKDKPKVTKDRK